MSGAAMGWVWKNSPYAGVRLLVHLALADFARPESGFQVWASLASIAERARVSRTVVVQTLSDMQDRQLIELVKTEMGEPSTYRLLGGVTATRSGGEHEAITNNYFVSSRKESEEQVIAAVWRPPLDTSEEIQAETRSWPKDPPPWRKVGMTRKEWNNLDGVIVDETLYRFARPESVEATP